MHPDFRNEPEAMLVARLKSGDPSAFRALLESQSARVLNLCYRFLLNRQDAEDLAQEVFVEIFQSIGSFRGQSRLSTWVYRIAVSRSLDELRKRRRKKRIAQYSRMLRLDSVTELSGEGGQPDSELILHESLSLVTKALNRLPDNQRVAFTLSRLEGYTNAEIAEIMQTTKIAVESLISRARKRVSGELESILDKKGI